MRIQLRSYQSSAAAMISDEISKGGEMTLTVPTGMGKTITVLSSIMGKSALFVSNHGEMRAQTSLMAEKLGVKIDCASVVRMKPENYDVILVCEGLRGRIKIDHPCVLFF